MICLLCCVCRYPFHWHLAGVQTESFVTDSTIEASHYRCVVLHGTHQVHVARNVAANVTGHCFYLEVRGADCGGGSGMSELVVMGVRCAGWCGGRQCHRVQPCCMGACHWGRCNGWWPARPNPCTIAGPPATCRRRGRWLLHHKCVRARAASVSESRVLFQHGGSCVRAGTMCSAAMPPAVVGAASPW